MTGRTVRDEVLAAWGSILERAGAPRSETHALALELEKAMEGRGATLPRTVRRQEPDAHWSDRPETAAASADYRVARRALRLSRAQLTAADFEVLKAAADGALAYRFDPGAAITVWVTDDGRNLTAAAVALEGRGLIDRAGPDEDGRTAGRLTEPGRRIWDELGELAAAPADGGDADA